MDFTVNINGGIDICLIPLNPTIENITDESADIYWIPNGSATLWNIEIGNAGFVPTGVPTYSGVTNPYTVSGLSSGITYDFYIQSDCGTYSSEWIGPYTFSTICNIGESYQ